MADVGPVAGASFTPKQGQYLACICYYSKLNRVPPAEADFARFFGVSPPAVHLMVLKLEADGWITRTPGWACPESSFPTWTELKCRPAN